LLLESYQAQSAQNNEIDIFAKKAIDIISKNRGTSSSVTAQRLDDADTLGVALTSKEREILTLVAGGLQNREIGERLGITEGTVKWHMQQIFMKLGVRRRAQAISAFRGSA
jgi:LuxR family maltose regulon positive regulatory protein